MLFHFLLQDIADSRLHPDLLGDEATTQIISFSEKGAVAAAAVSATSTVATTTATVNNDHREENPQKIFYYALQSRTINHGHHQVWDIESS